MRTSVLRFNFISSFAFRPFDTPLIPSDHEVIVSRDAALRVHGLYLLILMFTLNAFAQPLVIEKPHAREPLHMALLYEDMGIQPTALEIKKLLTSTGLFEIKLSIGSTPTSKKDITDYMHKGFSVVLFMQQSPDNHIAFRLYDATDASMLLGKNLASSSRELTQRLVADAVYSHLFNHASYFLTKIAYIKKSPTMRNKKRTELCILDPVDGASQTLVKDNRILVAPQWSRMQPMGHDKIWLSVSEFTPRNVRLLGIDLHGHSWPILDLDGTCVGTAQQDETTFVYVRSGILWLYEFDKKTKKSRHTRLTDGRNTCGCPSLLSSGDIIYSCNSKINRYDRHEKKSYPLSISGNCIAPDVHQPTSRIIFSRSVKGVLQLHSCNAQGERVTQLTFGPGNKIDACWSACGNYIVYTRCEGNHEQIALYNLMNQTERILTPEHQQCGYPSWSGLNLQLYS
jgi:hypothetical protein